MRRILLGLVAFSVSLSLFAKVEVKDISSIHLDGLAGLWVNEYSEEFNEESTSNSTTLMNYAFSASDRFMDLKEASDRKDLEKLEWASGFSFDELKHLHYRLFLDRAGNKVILEIALPDDLESYEYNDSAESKARFLERSKGFENIYAIEMSVQDDRIITKGFQNGKLLTTDIKKRLSSSTQDADKQIQNFRDKEDSLVKEKLSGSYSKIIVADGPTNRGRGLNSILINEEGLDRLAAACDTSNDSYFLEDKNDYKNGVLRKNEYVISSNSTTFKNSFSERDNAEPLFYRHGSPDYENIYYASNAFKVVRYVKVSESFLAINDELLVRSDKADQMCELFALEINNSAKKRLENIILRTRY